MKCILITWKLEMLWREKNVASSITDEDVRGKGFELKYVLQDGFNLLITDEDVRGKGFEPLNSCENRS